MKMAEQKDGKNLDDVIEPRHQPPRMPPASKLWVKNNTPLLLFKPYLASTSCLKMSN